MNGEIPKIFACPSCGEKVSGFESECPRCKKSFDASVKFSCPFCGEPVIAGSVTCSGCHVDFEGAAAQHEAESNGKSVEDLLAELQNVGKEEKDTAKTSTSECPRCGAIVPPSADKCAICGAAFQRVKMGGPAQVVPAPQATAKKAEPLIPKTPVPTPSAPTKKQPEKKPLPPPAAPTKFEVPQAITDLIAEHEPEVVWACPKCGKDVSETALQCPHCKTVFEPVEEEVEAPAPKTSKEEEAIKQLSGLLKSVDGVDRGRTRTLKPKLERAPAASKTTPPPAVVPTGRTNGSGIVNGKGAVNGRGLVNGKGAVNGRGLVNGKGAVNGRGLVNGKGATNGQGLMSSRGETNGRSVSRGTEFVNGTGVSNGIRPRRGSGYGLFGAKKVALKWQFLAVVIVITVVISAFVYLSYSRSSSAYTVDGDLGDWDDATIYDTHVVSSAPGVTVERWSFDTSDSSIYFYVRTQGPMMNTQQAESVLLYVDRDDSTDTGYLVDGIGADFLLTVNGWNGSVHSTSISQYGSSTDHLNWNAWDSFASLNVALSSNQLEASASLSESLGDSAKALLVYKDELEHESASEPVPVQGTLLLVEQSLAPSLELTDVVALSSSSQLAQWEIAFPEKELSVSPTLCC